MPLRRTRLVALLAACLGLIGAAEPSAAAVPARALLIGVQDYPGLPDRLHLRAPAGDVARLRTALLEAGMPAGDVTVMTEREGRRPTRAAILDALAGLAADARPGEQVLVYFSGHGAQAPARRPAREPDGLEELYLASDAAHWDGGAGRVPGALADFELEAALAAIRAKGAEVWFIADACHAAGLTRDATVAGARAKSVSAADLGAPVSPVALRAPPREAAPLMAQGRGGFTGFYAASPGYLALERPLPAGAPDATPASVFTFNLVRAMGQGRFRTLRDLALAASSSAETGAGAPAPVFEGALGGSVLGLTPAARTYRVRRAGDLLTVDAGVFEGFDAGAQVTLLAGPERRPAGTAHVTATGPASAQLSADGVAPDGPLSVRLERTAVRLTAPGDRLLAALRAPQPGGEADDLMVEARLLRAGCGPNPPARAGFPAGAVAFDLMAPPPLRHCDVVYLQVTNAGQATVDVSPLYLDASGAIADLSFAPRDDVRLAPGETRFAALRVLTRNGRGESLPHGAERLVLIAAPAGAQRLDLRSLAQASVLRGGPRARPELEALIFALRTQD
jgi:uncharacterized caspase-like protein